MGFGIIPAGIFQAGQLDSLVRREVHGDKYPGSAIFTGKDDPGPQARILHRILSELVRSGAGTEILTGCFIASGVDNDHEQVVFLEENLL